MNALWKTLKPDKIVVVNCVPTLKFIFLLLFLFNPDEELFKNSLIPLKFALFQFLVCSTFNSEMNKEAFRFVLLFSVVIPLTFNDDNNVELLLINTLFNNV